MSLIFSFLVLELYFHIWVATLSRPELQLGHQDLFSVSAVFLTIYSLFSSYLVSLFHVLFYSLFPWAWGWGSHLIWPYWMVLPFLRGKIVLAYGQSFTYLSKNHNNYKLLLLYPRPLLYTTPLVQLVLHKDTSYCFIHTLFNALHILYHPLFILSRASLSHLLSAATCSG